MICCALLHQDVCYKILALPIVQTVTILLKMFLIEGSLDIAMEISWLLLLLLLLYSHSRSNCPSLLLSHHHHHHHHHQYYYVFLVVVVYDILVDLSMFVFLNLNMTLLHHIFCV